MDSVAGFRFILGDQVGKFLNWLFAQIDQAIDFFEDSIFLEDFPEDICFTDSKKKKPGRNIPADFGDYVKRNECGEF